ncbi:MAG: ABC transporter permease subunit [Anaerolineae bacterium]|nr:ABC transporter permease subunit [Anaerolineae bacterium]
MSWAKNVIDRLLNPRSELAKLGRIKTDDLSSVPSRVRSRLRVRDVAMNPPLVMGSLITLALFLIVLFGPIWAPENPYVSAQHLVPHFDPKTGEYLRPPLSPSDAYPLGTDRWGNDLLSLLLHGARNTLIACAFITMVRVILGTVLGGWAGWNENKSVDRVVMGLIGVINSVPMLIGSMILIYALDIRQGLPTFIVALSIIGWTEIAQYIRSEFLVLRKMPFIEGARAVGLNSLAMAVRHVLPNVLSQLLVITFLEMGAVMMLLGELGFVGVYIGGGSRISIETDPFVFEFRTLIEIPEWGAMLADGYRWLRSRPFVIMPPAIAFFVSVVGFNALGEGLRRLIEKNGLNTAFLLRKRMLIVVAVLVFATVFIINNTGPAPWFVKVASAFSGNTAYEQVQALIEIEDRAAGREGGKQAAEYIAQKFQEYGLEPGWTHSSYIYPLNIQLVRPATQPVLALIQDGQVVKSFRHQLDFGFVIAGHGGSGDVQAPLTFVGFERGPSGYDWSSFKGLDLRDRIVLLLQENAPADFASEALIRGARGVLWVVNDEPDAVRSQLALNRPATLRQPGIPIFRIRPSVVEALLETDHTSLDELLNIRDSDQVGSGWFTRDLNLEVHVSLDLGEPQDTEIPCVLGYKPGTDYDLAGELVILFASYDSLGTDPDGTAFPAANQSASGIGVMLETARLWYKQDLDARRSVMFVAWGGGQLDNAEAEAFIQHTANFRHLPAIALNKPALLFQLTNAGAGDEAISIHPNSNNRLAQLLQETAQEVGIPVADLQSAQVYGDIVTRRIPPVLLSWSNSTIAPDQDNLERIEAARLQTMGELFALALTKIVRQTTY